MELNRFLAVIFLVMVIILLGGYSIYSFMSEEMEFSANPRNYNFSLNNSSTDGMQYYPNMRYLEKEISYRIDNCEKKKSQDMRDAFRIIENVTMLEFYEVPYNEELYITCNETTKFEKNMFIAGEAVPSKVVPTGLYNIILRGEILLIKDSTCENPNIAIHELLHTLGFNHSNNPNNIMYPVSSCKQTIGEEIPKLINEVYSVENLPDLMFEEATAQKRGIYLDINASIRNAGLKDANEFILDIISDGKTMKQFKIEKTEIGTGKKVTLTILLLTKFNLDNLNLYINSTDMELNKENNNIPLEIGG